MNKVAEFPNHDWEIEKDNAIVVSIPFDRLHLSNRTKATPQETPQETDTNNWLHTLNDTGKQILKYCAEPRSSRDIMEHLDLKDRKNLQMQIRKLLNQGC